MTVSKIVLIHSIDIVVHNITLNDESELSAFFFVITALSLFIQCPFLGGRYKEEKGK